MKNKKEKVNNIKYALKLWNVFNLYKFELDILECIKKDEWKKGNKKGIINIDKKIKTLIEELNKDKLKICKEYKKEFIETTENTIEVEKEALKSKYDFLIESKIINY